MTSQELQRGDSARLLLVRSYAEWDLSKAAARLGCNVTHNFTTEAESSF